MARYLKTPLTALGLIAAAALAGCSTTGEGGETASTRAPTTANGEA